MFRIFQTTLRILIPQCIKYRLQQLLTLTIIHDSFVNVFSISSVCPLADTKVQKVGGIPLLIPDEGPLLEMSKSCLSRS